MALENKIKLVVDSHHGIHIPKIFSKEFNRDLESNFDELFKDFVACLNVQDEWYWEAWQNILDNFWFIDDGIKYNLLDNGDLWAIPDNLTEEEQEELNQWN